ncbi:hypothetical protein E2562_001919 [Oryza meyeriana var. granulata]|uniref:Uncharacterized protein n=1 Tax=Oryza meyeriana var. granulata TaxID=110450 RepID=A0A6G1C4Y5_9ORYZ|nr:hypothetical protein E2562_001919 [Oryza meyeriana var. granulata]
MMAAESEEGMTAEATEKEGLTVETTEGVPTDVTEKEGLPAEATEKEGLTVETTEGVPTDVTEKEGLPAVTEEVLITESEKDGMIPRMIAAEEGIAFVEGQIKNVKDMLATGHLEGAEIFYKKKKGGPVLLTGRIQIMAYFCSCSQKCEYHKKALSACEFERHALDQDSRDTGKRATHNQNDHIYVQSEVSIYEVARKLKQANRSEMQNIFDEIKMKPQNKNCKDIASGVGLKDRLVVSGVGLKERLAASGAGLQETTVTYGTGLHEASVARQLEGAVASGAGLQEMTVSSGSAVASGAGLQETAVTSGTGQTSLSILRQLEVQVQELQDWKREAEIKMNNMQIQLEKHQSLCSDLMEVLKKFVSEGSK